MRLDIPVGERSIVLETGKLAKQAGGAVTARLGDTMILSTATRSQAPRPGATFLPLSVDIEERMSSAGKIPGGFIKREGRPSERAILTSRLTDRPLRPLFPKNYHRSGRRPGNSLRHHKHGRGFCGARPLRHTL
jgi:polyribonucleotide nucleotidyltransferase